MLNFKRQNNNWLRYRSLQELKRNHPDLYNSKGQPFFEKEWVSGKNSWIAILVFTIIAFLFGLIDLPFLNIFTLKYETAQALVDARITNIAALTSLTLVVVGFLINNLAVKDPITYRLLFRKAFIYPVTYLTLSTVGAFIFVSTLKDQISEYFFVRIVTAGTYLVFLVLFLIGLLFRKVITFANKDVLIEILQGELLNEFKMQFYDIMLNCYSDVILKKLLKQNNVNDLKTLVKKRSEQRNRPEKNEEETIFVEGESKARKMVLDINIGKLERELNHQTDTDNYYSDGIAIGEHLTLWDNFITLSSMDKIKMDRFQEVVRNIIITTSKRNIIEEVYLRYIEESVENAIHENKFRELEKALDFTLKIFEIQISEQFAEKGYFFRTNVTEELLRRIQSQILNCINNDKADYYYRLIDFVIHLLYRSIAKKNVSYYVHLGTIFESAFRIAYQDDNALLIEYIPQRICSAIEHQIGFFFNSIKDKFWNGGLVNLRNEQYEELRHEIELMTEFALSSGTMFSKLFSGVVEAHNGIGFKNTLEAYHRICNVFSL